MALIFFYVIIQLIYFMLFPKIEKAEQSTLSKQKGEYKLPTVDKILQEVMSGSKD